MTAAGPPPPPATLSVAELRHAHARLVKAGLVRSPADAARLLSPGAAAAWNVLIRAHARGPRPAAALRLFRRMLGSRARPDKFSFPFALTACAALAEALPIHARILKSGFGSDIYIQNTLISHYATAGLIEEALKLFVGMPQRDVISWNAMISALVAHGLIEPARRLFDEMPKRDVETWNFMISGYVSSGLVDEARELFDRMPARDVVSWNAMITACARAGCFGDVISLFQAMQQAKVHPDECTLVNVLSACARVGALGQGEWVHAFIDKNGIEVEGFLATALVDMYSKCGSIEKALQVFSDVSRKDVSTWNAMIEGLSSHGFEKHALRLFYGMPGTGFAPNEVTFVSVLSACSHAGWLNKGRRMFDDMIRTHGVEPKIEHYGCMVELLARSGSLKEADMLIRRVPVGDASVLWESLLGACRSHGDVSLAESVAKWLVELSPQDSAWYTQLSNIYASVGRWHDVREVREMMRVHGVEKEPGCSMIEVNGAVHEFFVGD